MHVKMVHSRLNDIVIYILIMGQNTLIITIVLTSISFADWSFLARPGPWFWVLKWLSNIVKALKSKQVLRDQSSVVYLTFLTNSFRLLSLWGRIIYLSNSASAKLITHNCNTGLLLDFKYFDSCWSSRPWWFNSSVWNCGWRQNIIESTRMDHLDLHGGDELFLAHYPVSRLVFLLNMASCHFGCFLPPKPPIFGPTWTWNDTWMGRKSAQNISPHCLGCVSAHYPVSRWIFC